MNEECLPTIMLLRRSPSALSHHQSPGWECGHVFACLVGQGHLVLGFPARRRLPSVVQMLCWKQEERFGVDVKAFVCGPPAANLAVGIEQACTGVLCQLQRVGPLRTTVKKLHPCISACDCRGGQPDQPHNSTPAEPGFNGSQVPTHSLFSLSPC